MSLLGTGVKNEQHCGFNACPKRRQNLQKRREQWTENIVL